MKSLTKTQTQPQTQAKILPPTPDSIQIAAKALLEDDVVGMPTETVYGLAGNGRSVKALARIFSTKERPTFDPLILHVGSQVHSLTDLENLKLVDASQIPPSVRARIDHLISYFWHLDPSPLTLVLPKHPEIPDLATSGLPSVALRMPHHPVAQALIQATQMPLAAPSANRFGRISPTTAEAVVEELGDRIHWVLDGGPCTVGVESTVIRFDESGKAQILRPGGTSIEKLREVLKEHLENPLQKEPEDPKKQAEKSSIPQGTQGHHLHGHGHGHGHQGQIGPGMLESHYAPEKPFILLPRRVPDLTPEDRDQIRLFLQTLPPHTEIGLLLMSGTPEMRIAQLTQWMTNPVYARTLSPSGSIEEAASRLFAEMRHLDHSKAKVIFAEPCSEQTGLAHAIRDRLRRASFQSHRINSST